jgi:hypothetical protein
MKLKKKIQTRKLKTQPRKLQTRKMTKNNKKPYTRKKRLYIGGQTTPPTSDSRPPTSDFTDKLINRILILIEGLILESIGQIGNIIGVDVSDPKQVNAKLDEIKVIVSDPEINQKVRVIVDKISALLFVALEAAQPYIKPMAEKVNKIYVTSTSDLGRSTITILKNIAKAIPIYGAIVALIDTANTVTVTAANSVTAQQHAQEAVNDAIREISDEFQNLLKQKKDLLSRIPTEVPPIQPQINPEM